MCHPPLSLSIIPRTEEQDISFLYLYHMGRSRNDISQEYMYWKTSIPISQIRVFMENERDVLCRGIYMERCNDLQIRRYKSYSRKPLYTSQSGYIQTFILGLIY
ncbi:hypothetical protein GDO81_027965 [Engystomops pustulosus]|uniref:Uncharacterized protein n=1 Tax=Engystomops pustulosus TaxID=76066 RepID=A0AAV6YJ76_ENGPU|nr:hypothetical protein GDO81_027965 [Engystomops pustulosus]